jgi:acetyltransferase-like isoleucine patch superfamily enzyme
MKEYKKKQWMRIRIAMILDSDKRIRYIKKHNVFHYVGDNFFFQPRVIPSDPELISFHNNVIVTSNVTFVTHDVFDLGLNNLNQGVFNYHKGCIEVMDNVFIGCNSTILSNVRIGPNAIIGAGSIVTHDVPPNSVVAGNPAKVIGTFDKYIEKRKEENNLYSTSDMWEKFLNNKNNINKV